MASTIELLKVMAGALGIEREVVADHANALREAELFPDDDDRAEPEHAAALLIVMRSGVTPDKAPEAVRLFGGLPLDCAQRSVMRPDGAWIGDRVGHNDPFMDFAASWGDNFAEFLTALINWFNEALDADFEITAFVMGGGPGLVSAIIYFTIFIEGGENAMGGVTFSLVPLGGGALPDDAPRARLDHQSIVPGAILSALRGCFTGDTAGPKQIFLTRADFQRQDQPESLGRVMQ